MDELLTQLRHDFPAIKFIRGQRFSWSPQKQTVIIPRQTAKDTQAVWSLLHETSHALLQHRSYTSDFELIQLEAAAWHKAAELGQQYGHVIDTNHVQDCLDTYRDWLHQRSTCPTCKNISLQMTSTAYRCYNCNANWGVSRSRLCRPYRLLQKEPRPTAEALSVN